MTGIEQGMLIGGLMILLLMLRMHIAMAMLLAGSIGYVWVAGSAPLLNYMKTAAFARYSIYDLSVVPLFLLMGQFATHGGLSRALFRAGNTLIGHWRGGMAMAAVGACAGFGAICGSSLATAATMGQVALPALREHKYSGRLATAAIAAGGTLGIMIPPSVPLVIYAILTEQNIAKLFMAAVIPGIVAMVGYWTVIAIMARIDPTSAPAGERATWGERLAAILETWPVMLIFLVVIGGIYGGYFTPTEAAAVGTLATGYRRMAFRRAATKKRLSRLRLWHLAGHGDDLPDPARRRYHERLPGADADADGTRQMGGRPRPLAAAGDAGDHHHLPVSRLHHGQPVDAAADHPDLLPHHHGPRLLGPGSRGQGDLVRHHRADGGRNRPDHAAGGHERVHHQQHGEGHADEGDLHRHRALPAVGPAAYRAAGVRTGACPDCAEAIAESDVSG
jgi:hypothetical protein